MADRMTRVGPRTGPGPGLMEHGLITRSEAIMRYRLYYQRQRNQAEAALEVTDDDLIVETFLGPYAQRDRKEVTDD